MANPNSLCAVAINEVQADGSYVSYRYWAQVVQMNDPRLPTRARIEVDLVHEWIQGVEPGAATIRFQRRQMRQRERYERREQIRLQRQREAQETEAQVPVVLLYNAAVQTEPTAQGTAATQLEDWRYCPTCGKKREREEEAPPASPPYSRTRWPTTDEEQRYSPRARTGR